MSADPASFMIARTSAKSRLMRPGTVMMSLIPWTPWRRTSSTTRKASRIEVFFWTTSREPVVRDRDQRVDLGLELLGGLLGDELAPVALEAERLGHDADRQRARASLAISATTGAAPEPVPPPRPAVMKTMSESRERLGDLLGVLLGRALADRRVAAGAEAAGDLVADPDLVRRVRLEERLGVRVAGDELDAHHLGPDHPVDGVAAAAADADRRG